MAQTQEIIHNAQIAIVEETGQDAFEAPGVNDVFLATINDPPWTPDSSNFERNENRNDFMRGRETVGPHSAEIQFSADLKGSGGAVDVPPELGEFFKSCGFLEDVNPASNVIYTPHHLFDGAGGNPGISYTCQVQGTKAKYAVSGAFGHFSIAGEHGVPVVINGSMMGNYEAPIATGAFLSPSYQSSVPPALLGATVMLAGGTPVGVQSFSIDMGTERGMGRDVTKQSGHYGARTTGRRITGSIMVEMLDPATTDFHELWRDGASAALTITIGTGTGGTVLITVPKLSRRPQELGSNDGIRTANLPWAATIDNGDAEGTDFSLTFT